MRTIESIRSASLGVWPLTAFLVMSLTEKIPNCIAGPFALPEYLYDCACSIHDCACFHYTAPAALFLRRNPHRKQLSRGRGSRRTSTRPSHVSSVNTKVR